MKLPYPGDEIAVMTMMKYMSRNLLDGWETLRSLSSSLVPRYREDIDRFLGNMNTPSSKSLAPSPPQLDSNDHAMTI